MLIAPKTGLETPKDRKRWALNYSTGLTPETMASLFDAADLGDLSGLNELLQGLLKDELIGGYADIALGSLSQRELQVLPNPSDPDPKRAAEVAAATKEWLSKLAAYETQGGVMTLIGGLPEIIEAIDSAMYFGLAYLWSLWEALEGNPLPIPTAVELIDQRRYRTKPETNELLLESEQGLWQGTPISQYDPWNLIPVVGRSLSPRKEFAGIGRAVAMVYYLKVYAGRLSLMTYAERYAIPAVIGTFSGTDIDEIKAAFGEDNLRKLQRFVENFISDAAGLFPPGFGITIAQVPRGGHDLFQYIEEHCQRALAIAFFGQDGTASGQGGSFAKAYVNEISRQDSVGRRGRRVCGYFQRLYGYCTELWFGPETPCAKFQFGLTQGEQAALDQQRLEQAQKLNLPVSLTHALNVLGLPEPQDQEVLIDGSTWDAKNRRRIPPPVETLPLKDRADLLRSAYPITSMLEKGVGLNVPKVTEPFGIPLDPSKPAYTPPLDPKETAGATPTKEGADPTPPEEPKEEEP